MTPRARASVIATFLRQQSYVMSSEERLQANIEAHLFLGGYPVYREVRLDRSSRIDFMVDDIGIEAKLKADRRAIYRQLERYASFEQIKALILITGTAMGLPAAINDKPLFYVSLGATAL